MPGNFLKLEITDPHQANRVLWENLSPKKRTWLDESQFCSREFQALTSGAFGWNRRLPLRVLDSDCRRNTGFAYRRQLRNAIGATGAWVRLLLCVVHGTGREPAGTAAGA